MKRFLLLLVIVAQLLVLLGMAGRRELIARTGRRIALHTTPFDPTDYMRGEYSRLNYDVSTVPGRLCADEIKAWLASGYDRSHRDAVVYATLSIGPNDSAQLTSLTSHEPNSGVYLRGFVDYLSGESVHVRYGIEAYFTQEGEAAKIDERRRGHQAEPLDAIVAVSAHGVAVLQSLRWNKPVKN